MHSLPTRLRLTPPQIDYQLSALAVRDDEVFALGGLQVTAPLKADTPHLAVVSLRNAAKYARSPTNSLPLVQSSSAWHLT